MKKEIPILFSTPMVQALLDDRKGQTRRLSGLDILNEKPDFYMRLDEIDQMDIPKEAIKYDDKFYYAFTGKFNNSSTVVLTCPYGKVGDILYVRENWKMVGWDFEDSEVVIQYEDEDEIRFEAPDNISVDAHQWIVKQYEKLLDKEIIRTEDEDETMVTFTGLKHPFSPSIHLPKWCSRIWLEVTNVRVERLHDIKEEDAANEGIATFYNKMGNLRFVNYMGLDGDGFYFPYESFKSLWISINGPESWKANPWVWVVSFKVLSKTGKPEIV